MDKPIAAKPSLYAHYFYTLKEIALRYGYNLVLHGSMNRDLDLVAIPWQAELGSHEEMVGEFAKLLGGDLQRANLRMENDEVVGDPYSVTHHGRMQYVIDLNRGGYTSDNKYIEDPQYYLDISVIPAAT